METEFQMIITTGDVAIVTIISAIIFSLWGGLFLYLLLRNKTNG